MRNRRVILTTRPTDIPQPEHFTLDECEVPDLGDGELLIRNRFLSVDPAQRGWALAEANYSTPVALGTAMRALAVGEVIASRDPEFRVGQHLYGWFDWQAYCICRADAVLRRVDRSAVPLSANASLLGINGLAAFIGLTRFGRPEPGEWVLVSTAAGSVGSFVGQFAHRLGARPVGLTSSRAKAKRCLERYAYEHVALYNEAGWAEELGQFAPEGMNVFFDSAGGEILDAGIRHMARHGRVVQCGTASIQAWSPPPQGPRHEREVLARRLQWGGFVIFDHVREFETAARTLIDWHHRGDLVIDEDISIGLETAPDSIAGLYRGENLGKRLIQLD
jgi:NADPH-dependent curcumin reductase CurA